MSKPSTGRHHFTKELNTIGITAAGSVNSEPTTGDRHFQKLLNKLPVTNEPDTQSVNMEIHSQPSTTGRRHYQRLRNHEASRTAAHGLGGVPKSFTLNGNQNSRSTK